MRRLVGPSSMAIAAGVLAPLAIGVAHLALTDIRHGEADLELEWAALRGAIAVLAVAQVLELVTIVRLRRRVQGS